MDMNKVLESTSVVYALHVYSGAVIIHKQVKLADTVDQAIAFAIEATVRKYDDGITSVVVYGEGSTTTYVVEHHDEHSITVNGRTYSVVYA
jgi:hypothetical protein